MKKWIPVFAALWAGPAATQSPCRYIAPAASITAAQWQECFKAKADAKDEKPSSPPAEERVACGPYAGAWPSERRLCR